MSPAATKCASAGPLAARSDRRLICRAAGDGAITYANDAYCDAVGIPREQLIGRTFWSFIPSHEHQRMRAYFASFRPDNSTGTIEHVARSEQGLTWLQRRCDFATFDDLGRPSEWCSVGEEAVTPNDAARDPGLIDPATVLALLADSITHELSQRLTSIGTNAEAALYLLESTPPDLSEVRDALVDIGSESERAAALIRRLARGVRHVEADHRLVDLNAVAVDAVALVREQCQHEGIRIDLRLAIDLPWVMGEEAPLRHVLFSLLVNACDAVGESELPSTRRRILIRTKSDDDDVVVCVVDRGRGVRGEPMRVFEPLYTTKVRGRGLGLAISRAIIARHGGHIALSNDDARTIFSVRVKAAPGVSATA